MAVAELKDVSKDYLSSAKGKPSRVLDQISLVVGENETIAITGPSGSGKTTLLNILGTLDQPTSGTVFLNGKAVDRMEEKDLFICRNRFLGFIFQQHLLLPQLTILENVLLPLLPVKEKLLKEEAMERAMKLLERVGLKNLVHEYPARIAVGECQRTAVVRALINRPGLILADEPTASLDARNAAILAELLTELQENYSYSLVIVTHDQEVAGRMKKQFRLNNGKLDLHP